MKRWIDPAETKGTLTTNLMNAHHDWIPRGGREIFNKNGLIGYRFETLDARKQTEREAKAHGFKHIRVFWHRAGEGGVYFLQVSRRNDL